ncbi:MAG: site-2 protease family protein [Calditrichaeota bacterium]|nr:MAG: site-2 protease family protein [Calditrichota bacterium]
MMKKTFTRLIRSLAKFRLPIHQPVLNLVLLLLTIGSTWLTWGMYYSLSLITILFCHEMGHYMSCRRHKVSSSLPFFLPFPFANPFGTLGAVIQLRSVLPNRNALFDLGAAGPIGGFIPAIAVIIVGYHFHPFLSDGNIDIGFLPSSPLFFHLLSFFTNCLKVSNFMIASNPVLYAGWVGLFVTSLNLLPIGQLDGGHIFYSLFGRNSLKWMKVFILFLGILSTFYIGWILLFLLLLIFGKRHPPPLDDRTPLDRKRKLIALFLFVVFILTFSPIPFNF